MRTGLYIAITMLVVGLVTGCGDSADGGGGTDGDTAAAVDTSGGGTLDGGITDSDSGGGGETDAVAEDTAMGDDAGAGDGGDNDADDTVASDTVGDVTEAEDVEEDVGQALECPVDQPKNGDGCAVDCGYDSNTCCGKTADKVMCECVGGMFFCYVGYDCSQIPVCPVCGDGQCTAGETCAECEQDCGSCTCGDGSCEGDESCLSCVADCGCAEGSACLPSGQCCTPDCDGIVCGDNGCGGSCGSCEPNQACNEGGQCDTIINECGDTSGLEQGPWPMKGMCPTRIGRTHVIGSQTGKEKWTYTAQGPIYSSPVVAKDGTIIVGSDDMYVHAITPGGQKKWTVYTGAKVRGSAAIGANGTIYIGSTNGTLYAIDPEDGSQVWTFPAEQPIVTSPVVGADGTVYFGYVWTHHIDKGNTPGPLVAVGSDGKQKFKQFLDGGSQVGMFAGCALGENFVFALPTSGDLVTLTLTGGQGFSYDAGNDLWLNEDTYFEPAAPTVAADGSAVFGAAGVGVRKITLNATQAFIYNDNATQFSQVAVLSDGSFVFGNAKNEVRLLDKVGFGQYVYKTGGSMAWSAPAVGGDDTIYIGSDDKMLYAFDPKLQVKWSKTTGGKVQSSPAIGEDGTVYVGSTDGKVYAFGD